MFARRELLNRHLKTHATERNIRHKEIWKDFEFRNQAPHNVNINITPQGHIISEHPTISTRLPKERVDDVSSHDKANNPSAEDDQLCCARGISDPDPDHLRYTIVCDSCSKSYHVTCAGLEEMPDTRICKPCNGSMSYEVASLLDRIKVDKGVVDRVRETPQFAAALFYFSRNLREKEQSEFHDPSGTLTTQECPSIIAIDEQSPHICEPMSEILPATLGSTWDGAERESWSGGVAIGHGNNTSSNPNLVDTSGCSPLFPDTEFLPRQVPNCDWTSSPEALSTEGQLDKPIDNITNGINSKPFLGGESTLCDKLLPSQPYHRKYHLQNAYQEIGRTLKEHSPYHNVTPEADGPYHYPSEFIPTARCTHKPSDYQYDRIFSLSLRKLTYIQKSISGSHLKNFMCTNKA
ncbi:hypothetical protein DL98DRAFT_18281 [Cadophora sp. DSE1049]|nr:hypothetical protein DL98DRAFT_18281 [Cadophora sp. DSE1049]